MSFDVGVDMIVSIKFKKKYIAEIETKIKIISSRVNSYLQNKWGLYDLQIGFYCIFMGNPSE